MTVKSLSEVMKSGFNSVQDMEHSAADQPDHITTVTIHAVKFDVMHAPGATAKDSASYTYWVDGKEVDKKTAVKQMSLAG